MLSSRDRPGGASLIFARGTDKSVVVTPGLRSSPCDDEAVDDASAAELSRLRARAYGPDADLIDDPAARSRLEELEAQLRAEREPRQPSVKAASRASEAPADTAGAGSVTPAGDAPLTDMGVDADEDAATSRVWELVHTLTSRLPPVATAMVAVSIAAAVALTASIVWGLASVPVISQTTASRQVATLEVSDDVAIPEGFFGTTSEQAIAYEYYGLLIVHSSAGGTFFGDDDCLLAVDTDNVTADGQGVNGPLYYGCRTGAFPATFEVALDSSVPAELRAQFPAGGALQFVLHGDRIGVFWDGGATPA